MIRALIFDFGRVISAWKPVSLFRSYEADLGLRRDTINTIMFDSPLWGQALVGKMSMDEYWQAIGPALNLHTAEAVSAFQTRYYADERINEDVLEWIRQHHGKYRLAVLSNHPPGLAEWLAAWAIDGYFDVIYGSGDEGAAKPDPRAYRTTLERLDVSPGEAVFIDDTPGHVAAARRLGIHGIVFASARDLETGLNGLTGVPPVTAASHSTGAAK